MEVGDWSKKFTPTNKYDFQVRVHILEARELQPRDRNGMSDPVCFVNVLGKKQHTAKHSKTTICTWDHLMFFEYNVQASEFFTGKLRVTVFDANTLLRDVEIGSFEFDLASIYQKPNHELYRQWVALSDSAGKFEGVQGYLRLSVVVLGAGDAAPAHNEEEEMDEEDTLDPANLQSLVLLPPSIQVQPHQLEINVFRAEGLPKMDKFGKCDGYVAAKFGGNPEIRTETVKNTFTPTWNEKLIIPFNLPTMSDIIPIQLRDWDMEGSDEVVGTVFLKLSEVMGTSNQNDNSTQNNQQQPKVDWAQPRWVNLYGTPDGTTALGITTNAKNAKKMNDGLLEGSNFRGRALMSVIARPQLNPKQSKGAVTAQREPAVSEYLVWLDVFEGCELSSKKKDVSVEIQIGSFTASLKKTPVKNGNCQFYKSLDDIRLSLPTDTSQIPDILLNLYKHSLTGKQRIGFLRIKASTLSSQSPVTWGLLNKDIFNPPKHSDVSGFLQYRIRLGPMNSFVGKRELVVKPKMIKYQLRAHIYQGKDLPSGDADGSCDPYTMVRLGSACAKTKTIKGTCFPLWYESLVMDVELPEALQFAPDIHCMLFDWDQLSKNDFLGRFSVSTSKLSEKMPLRPTWYPLYFNDPAVAEGEVLASFQLIPADHLANYKVPASIVPPMKECSLEISVIGVRTLLPFRLLPVNKPFVEFDCGGRLTSEKIKTKVCSFPSGPNANHLEVLELSVQIPEDRLFAPPLNIRVRDDRTVYKPIVASRSISLEPFIPWLETDPAALLALQEDTPPPVDTIPGAPPGSAENSNNNNNNNNNDGNTLPLDGEQSASPDHVVLDIPAEDKQALVQLEQEDENYKSVRQAMLRNIASLKDHPIAEVAESFLEGARDDSTQQEDTTPKRETCKNELELSMKNPTFGTFTVYRAKKKQGRSIRVEAGKFKGKFRIVEKGSQVPPPVDLLKMYQPTDYVLRVYCLEAFQLVPKDRDGKNNPYIRVKVNGKTVVKDVDNKKQDTGRPSFFKCHEFKVNFPTQNQLAVGVWDWNAITKDELIGQTTIDLENRVFSDEWKAYALKPMEYRTLWSPSSSSPQGQLKLWLDIMTPEDALRNPPENIAPPVPIPYELRVIVYETKEVAFKDKNMSDIFVVGYPEGQEPQMTDTHWRSEDGKGSFNWRMKFPIVMPSKNHKFKLQVWDKDILNPNDAICECNLNLGPFFRRVYKNKSSSELLAAQWIKMTHPSVPPSQIMGHLNVSFELLTIEEAQRKPAGFGRKEPNENPFLPAPDRPETSFNPFRFDKYLTKIAWGQNKGKIMGVCIGCLVIVVLIIIIYFSVIVP